jgi:outer membrane protein
MIKKITAVCAFVLGTSTFCMAQTSMGTWSVGGGMSFSGTRNQNSGNEVKYTSYTFGPSVGYFVADNLMVGANLSMGINRQQTDNATYKQTSFGIGPFLRYYRFTKNEQFAFFGDFGFDFSSGSNKQNNDDPTKSCGFDMYLAPGFTWFPTSHWGIDSKWTC